MPQIHRLALSELVLPDGHPEAWRGRRSVVAGFAIDHPEGVIVVDTGVGRGNPFIDEWYSPTVFDLPTALVAVGIDPARVAAIVNSHLHFDHCGQNPNYYGTSVPVFVQLEEIEAARDPGYTVPEWATVPAGQLRAVRGDEEIADGIWLLATPGHTRGHQSVAVRAGEDVAVIAAQSVWGIAEFDDGVASPANADAELLDVAADSIRRLKALHPTVAYFSHDTRVYRRAG